MGDGGGMGGVLGSGREVRGFRLCLGFGCCSSVHRNRIEFGVLGAGVSVLDTP